MIDVCAVLCDMGCVLIAVCCSLFVACLMCVDCR